MHIEHVLTYQHFLSIGDADYMATKANKLGKLGKTITRTYQQEDAEGMHIYFEIHPTILHEQR